MITKHLTYRKVLFWSCSSQHNFWNTRQAQLTISFHYISLTAAPPPYSQTPDGNSHLTPLGLENRGYASLYSAPPAYEATARIQGNKATTTGIGSVTSLRDAARDDG